MLKSRYYLSLCELSPYMLGLKETETGKTIL